MSKDGGPPPGDAPPPPPAEGGAPPPAPEGGAPPPTPEGGAPPPAPEGGAPPPATEKSAPPPAAEGGAPPPAPEGGTPPPAPEGGVPQPPPAEGGAPPPPPAEGGAPPPAPEGGVPPPPSEGATPPPAPEGGGVPPKSTEEKKEKEKKAKKEKSDEKKEKKEKGDKKKKSSSKSKKSSSSKSKKKLGDLDLGSAKIGFLGAGKMTESIIQGLINHAKVSAKQIYVGAPSTRNYDKLKELGVNVSKRMIDIFGKHKCELIFLAMHGGAIKDCHSDGGRTPRALMTNYIPHPPHPLYILSLVTGVTMEQIKAVLLNPDSPSTYKVEWHRIMINAACAYGAGICAVDVEPDSKKLSAPLRTMLSSMARLEYVSEICMDAACAAGGNGLAFSYYFIQAMSDGGFKMGLSRSAATKFAAKTFQCAAQAVLESGKHPNELRDSVCAPSGPAIYGLHILDKADVQSGIVAAVEAAYKRSTALSS